MKNSVIGYRIQLREISWPGEVKLGEAFTVETAWANAGVSFHRVCGWTGQPYDNQGNLTLQPEMETAIRELQLPMTRFYALGDEPFGVESSIDRAAEVCRRVGIVQDRCVLELEEQGATRSLPPGKRFLLYWLYYYFNRHVGEWVLGTDGSAPYHQPRSGCGEFAGPLTPVLATLSADGREIFLVIANGSRTRAVPCRARMENFPVAHAKGTIIMNDRMDGKPMLQSKDEAVTDFPVTAAGNEVTCVVPPHAIIFVALAGMK